MRKITDIDRGAWLSIQILIESKFESAAKQIADSFDFSLEYQKQLQDDEGNSYQEVVENFWNVEYK